MFKNNTHLNWVDVAVRLQSHSAPEGLVLGKAVRVRSKKSKSWGLGPAQASSWPRRDGGREHWTHRQAGSAAPVSTEMRSPLEHRLPSSWERKAGPGEVGLSLVGPKRTGHPSSTSSPEKEVDLSTWGRGYDRVHENLPCGNLRG